jgi:hypothetical protein
MPDRRSLHMRHPTNRSKAALAIVAIATMILSLLPGSAWADHHANTLEVDPESQSHQAGEDATLTATFGSPLTLLNPNVDFEIETGPGDTDGNTPKSPDMTCSPLIGLLGCSVTYTSTKRGVDVVRAWIDFDNDDATNEYDNDEFPNEATDAGAGHKEPDNTDVVLVLWNQGPPARLDCDDSSFNDTEQNFSQGPGSGETYTCKVSDGGGVGMEGFAIDGENLSTTGVNDPETPGIDYNNFCVTGGNGVCQGTIPSLGKTGTADICLFVDADDDAVYDPTAAQGDPDFGEHDGGDCDGEVVAEAENNDVTDVVQITWILENVPPVTRIDRPAHLGFYPDTGLTKFNGLAKDTHSTVVKVEIALRKYRTDGRCGNWNGTAFVIGPCNFRSWVTATITGTTANNQQIWEYSLPPGTKLARTNENKGAVAKFYILLARSTDSNGIVEIAFKDGQNRNRFEICPEAGCG